MKYVVIMTDGKRVKPAGFKNHPIIFRNYEQALEYAYDMWLRFPNHNGGPVLYEVIKFTEAI